MALLITCQHPEGWFHPSDEGRRSSPRLWSYSEYELRILISLSGPLLRTFDMRICLSLLSPSPRMAASAEFVALGRGYISYHRFIKFSIGLWWDIRSRYHIIVSKEGCHRNKIDMISRLALILYSHRREMFNDMVIWEPSYHRVIGKRFIYMIIPSSRKENLFFVRTMCLYIGAMVCVQDWISCWRLGEILFLLLTDMRLRVELMSSSRALEFSFEIVV